MWKLLFLFFGFYLLIITVAENDLNFPNSSFIKLCQTRASFTKIKLDSTTILLTDINIQRNQTSAFNSADRLQIALSCTVTLYNNAISKLYENEKPGSHLLSIITENSHYNDMKKRKNSLLSLIFLLTPSKSGVPAALFF